MEQINILLNNHKKNEVIKNLYFKIINEHLTIAEELNKILKNETKYKYSNKKYKIKKHFPATVLTYDECKEKLNKYECKKVSFSLSSKTINEQITEILDTLNRRINTTTILGQFNALEIRHNLSKYNNLIDITQKFPEFVHNERVFFDIVYVIKTENPHFYINHNKNLNKNTFCDSILICCIKNKYHIMFSLDEKNSYYKNLINAQFDENYIKKTFEDKTI